MLVRKLLAVFFAGNGIVWFLQGIGVFTVFSSAMNNDLRWAAAGLVVFVASLLLWPKGGSKGGK